MAKQWHCLAIDLEAAAGRGLLGSFDGDQLSLSALRDFPNRPSALNGHVYWNILELYENTLDILASAAKKDIQSVGIASWGVDYCLFDKNDDLLGLPYHYRDKRTNGVLGDIHNHIHPRELYDVTGISFEQFNTLTQLLAEGRGGQGRLERAKRLLSIADTLNWFLGGEACTDTTMAATTQLLNIRAQEWDAALLQKLGFPSGIFPAIVAPGGPRGNVRQSLQARTSLAGLPVIGVAGHDVASAVIAVPTQKKRFAFVSSDTWSLMGLTCGAPVINEETYALNYSNELCATGSVLLKNIMGMWLVEECRKSWISEGNLGFSQQYLTGQAQQADAFASLIDPNYHEFYTPGDMPGKIDRFCRATGQPVPVGIGGYVRCILESLALTYRKTFLDLQRLGNVELDCLHIIGGGCRNRLLNQFAADAIAKPVIAGPTKATARGNILVQLLALGELASFDEVRQLAARYATCETFQPQNSDVWELESQRFARLCTMGEHMVQDSAAPAPQYMRTTR